MGKAANDAANGAAFQHFIFEEHWVPLETVVDVPGSPAGHLHRSRSSEERRSGPQHTRQFPEIYRRQPDGSWWMTHDMYSSDQPADAN